MAKLHVAGFFENIDQGGTKQNLAALVDTLAPAIMKAEATDYLIVDPRLRFIAAGYVHADATVQPRATLVAPSMKTRYNGITELEVPTLASTAEPATPAVFNDWRANPIELDGGERLSLEMNANPAAAADQFGLFVFSDGPVSAVDPRGGYWHRFTTAASALTANGWNSRSLTASQTLKKGRYEVLAGKAISTSLVGLGGRLNFPLGDQFRPPIAAADALEDIPHAMFNPGQMGVLGQFDDDNLPVVELLPDAADNEVQVVYLYIRPIGGGARAA